MHKEYQLVRNKTIPTNYTDNLPYNPRLKQRAINLRKTGILSEVLFWQEVHKGKFWKIDFDRQKTIASCIVDFYVKSLSLVIEIDGSGSPSRYEGVAAGQTG